MTRLLRRTLTRASRLSRHPSFPLLVAMLGTALCVAAVGSELSLDDYVLALAARKAPLVESLGSGPSLFTFASGDPTGNAQLMRDGLMLPWWTDPELKISFLRPLSSALHRLDFALWPGSAEAMYVHSLVWLAAMIAAAGVLYRRIEGVSAPAALGTLLFALGDGNGAAVGWLSNRNLLLGVLFCALSLSAHHRSRQRGRVFSGWALAWFLAGLAAGEVGVSSLCYLFAYSLVFDTGSIRQRTLGLLPVLGAGAAWQTLRWVSGAGVSGSGGYLHPLGDFSDFVAAFPLRALALLGASLGPGSADAYFAGSAAERGLAVALGLSFATCTAFVAWPAVRQRRSVRFWSLGALLSTVPLTAAFPSDRMLPVIRLGLMPVVAHAITLGVSALEGPFARARQGLAALLVLVHGVLSPICLPLQAGRIQLLARAMHSSFAALDGVPGLEEKTLVVLGGPTDFWISYLQAERAYRRQPRPRNVVWLAHPEPFLVDFGEPDVIEFKAPVGFFSHPAARLYRVWERSPGAPHSFRVPGVSITTLDPDDHGAPRRVRFSLSEPPERYTILIWQHSRYELLAAEARRGSQRIETQSMFSILLAELS